MFKVCVKLILCLSLGMPLLAQAAPAGLCTSVFADNSAPVAEPTYGATRGPIEWFRNLKMKWRPSRVIKSFDQNAYEKFYATIKEQDLRVEDGYIPKTVEEYVAYLDVQLASLNTSIINMQPIFRHKIYKTINKILQGNDPLASRNPVSSLLFNNSLSELVFRGSVLRPSSFAYLLTHSPEAVSHELFVQHIYSLAVAKTVVESLEYSPGPRRPGFFVRKTPQFVKRHKEYFVAAFWAGWGIATTIQNGVFNIFLGNFSIYKTAANKEIIEKEFIENGYESAMKTLEPAFATKSEYNYIYLVAEKTLNWSILPLLAMDIFL